MTGWSAWRSAFLEWSDKYFFDSNTEDEPYSFDVVREAFHAGYVRGRGERLKKEAGR